jgi:hypothetical protein
MDSVGDQAFSPLPFQSPLKDSLKVGMSGRSCFCLPQLIPPASPPPLVDILDKEGLCSPCFHDLRWKGIMVQALRQGTYLVLVLVLEGTDRQQASGERGHRWKKVWVSWLYGGPEGPAASVQGWCTALVTGLTAQWCPSLHAQSAGFVKLCFINSYWKRLKAPTSPSI